jgi:hypothetical protein
VDHPASPAVTLTTSCRGIAALTSVLSQCTPKRRVCLDARQNGMDLRPLVAACAPSSVRLPPRWPRRDSGLRGAHRAGYRDRSDAPRAPWRRAPRFHSRRSGAGYAAGHAGRPGSAPPAEGGRWPAWVASIFTINLTIYIKIDNKLYKMIMIFHAWGRTSEAAGVSSSWSAEPPWKRWIYRCDLCSQKLLYQQGGW